MYAIKYLIKKYYRIVLGDFFEGLLPWNRSCSVYFLGVAKTDSSINYDGYVDEEGPSKFSDPDSWIINICKAIKKYHFNWYSLIRILMIS